MKVAFKITIWEEVEIPENLEDKVLIDLKNKEIKSADDLCNKYSELSSDVILDTSTQMTVKENKGSHTIEVLDENGKSMWNNLPKTVFRTDSAEYEDDSPMPFGEHKDEPLGDLPANYLLFLYNHRSDFLSDPQFPNNQKLKRYIERNLNRLELLAEN